MGDRISDSVTSAVGSWRFILIQSSILALWIILNSAGWFIWKWDLPPFILLNLCLSFQAAFTGPFVMMSQSRQTVKDRLRDDHEAITVDMMAVDHKLLMEMNKTQLAILEALHSLQAQKKPTK